MPIQFTEHPDSFCPKCNAPETNPSDPNTIIIRAYKVYDDKGVWSQCLNCAGYYTYRDGKITPVQGRGDPAKGWFCEPR